MGYRIKSALRRMRRGMVLSSIFTFSALTGFGIIYLGVTYIPRTFFAFFVVGFLLLMAFLIGSDS